MSYMPHSKKKKGKENNIQNDTSYYFRKRGVSNSVVLLHYWII